MQRQLPPNRLKELREAAGLKPYDLSARFRIHPTTVFRWETGDSPVPDHVKLELAALYGVTPSYLMGWSEEAAA